MMMIRLFVGMFVEMMATIISVTAHILGSVVEVVYKAIEYIAAKGKGGQY